jgi:hypothetical protein
MRLEHNKGVQDALCCQCRGIRKDGPVSALRLKIVNDVHQRWCDVGIRAFARKHAASIVKGA